MFKVSNSSEEIMHRFNLCYIPSVSIERDFFLYMVLLQLSSDIKVSLNKSKCTLK